MLGNDYDELYQTNDLCSIIMFCAILKMNNCMPCNGFTRHFVRNDACLKIHISVFVPNVLVSNSSPLVTENLTDYLVSYLELLVY